MVEKIRKKERVHMSALLPDKILNWKSLRSKSLNRYYINFTLSMSIEN